ncbi:MAG: DUF5018-related domain-containing protein [Cellulophaga sp.]|uniref:DUF5018-related domain-containing protein n=1 Tax=unclassified Cellulophaga TaxID=2634405 RepID=UPI000C2C5406|nr:MULTISPECIES: hypothetical protein [unclassified Cellulophaga]MDO6492398.1 hypothetical protein [Cellulophaga sp. 2_MG-2023]MDO6496102.1 hypothetical protein [Cellulophaga sp. 3_MG-2023]PKB44944.1 hypothetical protein AX016_3177 [Cellulophaga sp. RHA19]
MKKIITHILVLLLCILSTSCLKSGLDDLPAFSDAEITSFKFEYRWIDDTTDNNKLQVIQLPTETMINTEDAIINCIITVPAANADFSAAVRDNVTLSTIVGYTDISTAATIAPVGSAPTLGKVADFSADTMQYKVTAADDSSKVWTLVISEFIK